MLSVFARIILTGSAFTPLAFIYAVAAFVEYDWYACVGLFSFGVFFTFLGLILFYYAGKTFGKMPLKMTSIEAADKENTSLMILYLLPLFTTPFASLNWYMIIPTILGLAVVVSRGYIHHFNPLLFLFGWHFYRIGTQEGVTYILISKKQIRSTKNQLAIVQLNEYTLLDVDKVK